MLCFCFVLLIFAIFVFDFASFCFFAFFQMFICSFPFLLFSFLSLPCFLDSLLLAQWSQLLLTLYFSGIQRVNRIRFFGDFIASMGAAVPTSIFQVEDLSMVDDFSLSLEEGHHPQEIFGGSHP